MATEQEMMADLAAADAAGDAELARHIASLIKAAREPGRSTALKVVDTVSDALPATGALVAGAAVTPAAVASGGLGIPLIPAAGAGGWGVGEFAKRGIDKLSGRPGKPPPVDVLSSSAKGASESMNAFSSGEVLSKAIGAAASKLRQIATSQGRRFLEGGRRTFGVTYEPTAPAAVEEAFKQGAIRPGMTTQQASDILEQASKVEGKNLGDLIGSLEAKGVRGPSRMGLADDLSGEARALAENSLGSPQPGVYRGVARELMQKEGAETLGLGQAEAMKRTLQKEADYGRLFDPSRNMAKKGVASRLRSANEAAVDAQADLAPQEAAQFVPQKQLVGRINEARDAARVGAAAAATRRSISLSDMLALIAGSGAGHAAGAPSYLTGPAAMAFNHLARTRGTSTVAAAARGAGGFLEGAAETPNLGALLEFLYGPKSSQAR